MNNLSPIPRFLDRLALFGTEKLLAIYFCISGALYIAMEISDFPCWTLFGERGVSLDEECLAAWRICAAIFFLWLLVSAIGVCSIRAETKDLKQAKIIIISFSIVGLIFGSLLLLTSMRHYNA